MVYYSLFASFLPSYSSDYIILGEPPRSAKIAQFRCFQYLSSNTKTFFFSFIMTNNSDTQRHILWSNYHRHLSYFK